MGRVSQIGSLALLLVGVSLAHAQKAPKDPPPPAAPKPAKPVPGPKAGTPKAIPKGAARVVNPNAPVTQLFRMTPEQRERALEPFPRARQEQFRKTLAWFDSLPKDQQEMHLRRIQRFEQLSPEKRAEFRKLIASLEALPPGRRTAVSRAVYNLQQMNDKQRENTLNRQQFKNRFSPEEYKIISGLADAWMGPQP